MKVTSKHRQACEAQGKPNGLTSLGYGCGDGGSTPYAKLPSFKEWMEDRDPVMVEAMNKWLQGLGTTAALLGIGYGGYKAMNRPNTPAAEPAAIVAKADDATPAPTKAAAPDSPTMKWQVTPGMKGPDDFKSVTGGSTTVDDEPTVATPKKGKTFNMRGGHSGYGNVKTTVERPRPNVWVFNITGEIRPRDAIKQAKDIVQDELGQRTSAGLSASFDPTETGMTVTINFTSQEERDRIMRSMGN